jgi:hypothetical protein
MLTNKNTRFGPLIKFMLSLFPNFEVKFVKRKANVVAHILAMAAYISRSSCCLFDLIPLCIENSLINEMS